MNNQKKAITKLKQDIKKKNLFDEKFTLLISDLYKQRLFENEKEKKVLIDRFLISTEGKDVVLENKLSN